MACLISARPQFPRQSGLVGAEIAVSPKSGMLEVVSRGGSISQVPTVSTGRPRWYDRKRTVQLIAFAASIVGAIFVLVAPAFNAVSGSSSGSVETASQTLLDVNGTWVI